MQQSFISRNFPSSASASPWVTLNKKKLLYYNSIFFHIKPVDAYTPNSLFIKSVINLILFVIFIFITHSSLHSLRTILLNICNQIPLILQTPKDSNFPHSQLFSLYIYIFITHSYSSHIYSSRNNFIYLIHFSQIS